MFCHTAYCSTCQKDTMHEDQRCSECYKREKEEKEFAWEMLSNSDKLTDLRKRIEKLERGPTRYA